MRMRRRRRVAEGGRRCSSASSGAGVVLHLPAAAVDADRQRVALSALSRHDNLGAVWVPDGS